MRRPRLSLAIIALFASACQGSDLPSGPESPAASIATPNAELNANTWVARTGMPTGRYGLAAAVVNGRIYAIGGETATGISAKVEVYDPGLSGLVSWFLKAPMPEPRSFTNGAAAINGKIYVSGGFKPASEGERQRTKTLYRYDPVANTWVRKADLPQVTSGGATVAIDGKLYVYVTYGSDNSDGAALYRYDPGSNAWTERATPPAIQNGAAAVVLGGKMWVIGGKQGKGSAVTNVSAYDPTSNSWAVRHPLHAARTGAVARVIDGRIYVAGGGDGVSTNVEETEVYTPGTDSWAYKADIRTPRSFAASGVVNGLLYVFGGTAGSYRTNEMYIP
jgi:N-acetylneuraminic acid mutarotase